MFTVFTQNEAIRIAYFIEGGKIPSKERTGCLCPSYHDVLWWRREASVAFRCKRQSPPQAYSDKVAWQIILSPTKRKTNPYRYMQLQAITHLH